MSSLIIAKEKIKGLTARLEKSLYDIKYRDRPITALTNESYNYIKDICEKENIDFPLKKVSGEIKIKCDSPQIFCNLSKLADKYGIVLDSGKNH